MHKQWTHTVVVYEQDEWSVQFFTDRDEAVKYLQFKVDKLGAQNVHFAQRIPFTVNLTVEGR